MRRADRGGARPPASAPPLHSGGHPSEGSKTTRSLAQPASARRMPRLAEVQSRMSLLRPADHFDDEFSSTHAQDAGRCAEADDSGDSLASCPRPPRRCLAGPWPPVLRHGSSYRTRSDPGSTGRWGPPKAGYCPAGSSLHGTVAAGSDLIVDLDRGSHRCRNPRPRPLDRDVARLDLTRPAYSPAWTATAAVARTTASRQCDLIVKSPRGFATHGCSFYGNFRSRAPDRTALPPGSRGCLGGHRRNSSNCRPAYSFCRRRVVYQHGGSRFPSRVRSAGHSGSGGRRRGITPALAVDRAPLRHQPCP